MAAGGDGGCVGWRVDSAVAAGVDFGLLLADAAANVVAPCVQSGHAPGVWVTTHGDGAGGGGDLSMLSARGSYGAPPVVIAAVVATDVHYAGVELVSNAAAALLRPHGSTLPDVANADVAAAAVAVHVYLRLPTAAPRACRWPTRGGATAAGAGDDLGSLFGGRARGRDPPQQHSSLWEGPFRVDATAARRDRGGGDHHHRSPRSRSGTTPPARPRRPHPRRRARW